MSKKEFTMLELEQARKKGFALEQCSDTNPIWVEASFEFVKNNLNNKKYFFRVKPCLTFEEVKKYLCSGRQILVRGLFVRSNFVVISSPEDFKEVSTPLTISYLKGI